jgi:hypothetical protein
MHGRRVDGDAWVCCGPRKATRGSMDGGVVHTSRNSQRVALRKVSEQTPQETVCVTVCGPFIPANQGPAPPPPRKAVDKALTMHHRRRQIARCQAHYHLGHACTHTDSDIRPPHAPRQPTSELSWIRVCGWKEWRGVQLCNQSSCTRASHALTTGRAGAWRRSACLRDLSLENVCRSTPRWLWRGQRGGGALEVGGGTAGEPGSHQGCSRRFVPGSSALLSPVSTQRGNGAMIISMVLIQAASH